VLIIMSDHGFKSFDRALNLNTWLLENGYLFYKNEKRGDWFQGIDWEKTKAYTFGLTGIYLNLKGREGKGIVEPKKEAPALRKELAGKLQGLMDEEKNRVAIKKVYDTYEIFNGPYVANGPDLIIGYNIGYRASWEAAVGNVSEKVIDDNTRSWSGDHCIDPTLVPGVFFCNRKISTKTPNIIDIAPSVLDLFGAKIPAYMKGTRLFSGQPQ
jgi:predicted AlkP superfamily phosphohydrolase/phosphomutase